MSDMGDKMIEYEKDNYDTLVEKFLNVPRIRNDWEQFVADMFSQQSLGVIQNFAEWLDFYEPTPGDYEADIFKIKINKVETYEKNLIVCQKQ